MFSMRKTSEYIMYMLKDATTILGNEVLCYA